MDTSYNDHQLTFLYGRVQSGRGIATRHCQKHSKEIEAAVGRPIYPGSLNVILDHPVRFSRAHAYPFDHGHRFLWHATLFGHPVCLYRWSTIPLHICEIIADVQLRSHFQLADRAPVILAVDKRIPCRPDLISRIGWLTLWLGRKRWYYDFDYYERLVRYYTWRVGAAQKPWNQSCADQK